MTNLALEEVQKIELGLETGNKVLIRLFCLDEQNNEIKTAKILFKMMGGNIYFTHNVINEKLEAENFQLLGLFIEKPSVKIKGRPLPKGLEPLEKAAAVKEIKEEIETSKAIAEQKAFEESRPERVRKIFDLANNLPLTMVSSLVASQQINNVNDVTVLAEHHFC